MQRTQYGGFNVEDAQKTMNKQKEQEKLELKEQLNRIEDKLDKVLNLLDNK